MGFRVRPLAVGAALLALSLCGCNKIGFVYDFADKLLLLNLEDTFDLDKTQRARLKDDVEAYFHWHRKTMLPRYADFLQFVADSARNGLRPAQVDSGFRRYQELYRETMEPLAGKATTLLLGLTPGQIDAWMDKQHKKNDKLRKDFSGSLQERLEHRGKKVIDELEDWTGRLGKDQRARIMTLNASLPWNGNLWLDLRAQIQDRAAAMARRRAPADSLRALLSQYFQSDDALKSAEYRMRNREFEKRLTTLIYMIHNTLTPEQRRRFLQQVEKLAQDFRAKSQQD